jgi:hypothetical protein
MKDWLTNVLRREVGAGDTAPPGDKQHEIDAFNRELDRLSALVTQHWQGEPDAVAAIREQRRG